MSFSNPVVAGEDGELIRNSIQSEDYVPGVSGWTINRDGSAEFNNITIRVDITTGSILIGPATGPQVSISADAFRGKIEFPSNAAFENTEAFLYGVSSPGDPAAALDLRMQSATVTANKYAFLQLSSESQNLVVDQTAVLGVNESGNNTQIQIRPDVITVLSDAVNFTDEIVVASTLADANNPERVTDGIVGTTVVNTPISTASNTLIGGAAISGVALFSGYAYEVEIQIGTFTNGAVSAAGTQGLVWRLWRGAVGGTEIGHGPVSNWKTAAVTSAYEDHYLKFMFEHTAATAVYTLNLSAQHTTGTDDVRAQVNPHYTAIVRKIGNPAVIANL